MNKENKNESGCICQMQYKSDFRSAMKMTHLINNTAAVGGSPVKVDGWLHISGYCAVGRLGYGAKQAYQIHLESTEI